MKQSKTLSLARDLIQKQSVTPDDAGCQQLIANRLELLGFSIEFMPFGKVTNLWARYGSESPLLVLAGHTDVVPTGDISQWRYPPFSATIDDGHLHGRGAADMKSSVAAMVCAVEELFSSGKKLHGSIAFLLTSDEEGDADDGTQRVVDALLKRDIRADYIVVGEPSSQKSTADTVRVGRRGSLTGWLQLNGKQGHVAYPDNVINPIHAMGNIIAQLSSRQWDSASKSFPATSFQFVSCSADAGATNVVPGFAKSCFNFRFSNQVTNNELQSQVENIVSMSGLDYKLDWRCSAQPFLSSSGVLHDTVADVIKQTIGAAPDMSTGGGTSDGRFLIHLSNEVVEIGPCNATIHQINECISLEELETITKIYASIVERLVFTL